MTRLRKAMERMFNQKIIITYPDKPTPITFPIMVDRLRDRMSSESLSERIKRMSVDWG